MQMRRISRLTVIALTAENVVRSVPFVRLQLKKLWTDLYQIFTDDRLWESTVEKILSIPPTAKTGNGTGGALNA